MRLPLEKEEGQTVKGHGRPPMNLTLTVGGPKGVFI